MENIILASKIPCVFFGPRSQTNVSFILPNERSEWGQIKDSLAQIPRTELDTNKILIYLVIEYYYLMQNRAKDSN